MNAIVPHHSSTRAAQISLIFVAAVLAISLSMLLSIAPKWTAVGVAVLLFAAIAAFKTEAAIVLYTLTAFVVVGPILAVSGRFGHTDGLYSSELMLGLLALAWGGRLVFQTIREKRVPLRRSEIDLPLLALVSAAVFSFVAALFTWDYTVPTAHRYYITQITEIALMCMPIFVYLLVSNSLHELRWIKAVYRSVLLVGAVGFLIGCPWIKVPVYVRTFWTGLLPVPLISFLYAYIVFQPKLDWKLLVAILVLTVLLVVQFGYLSWVVMWFSTSVSLCVISWHRSRKLFVVVACSVILFILLLRADLLKQILTAEAAEGSTQRFKIWASCIKMALASPVWGIGPDNFYPYYSHRYADVFGTANVSSPHSNYFQILVQYGFLGLAAFLWFLLRGYRMLVRFHRDAVGPWEKSVFVGATGLFVGMACGAGLADYLVPARANGGLVSFSTTVYPWIVLGLAVSLHRVLRDSGGDKDRSDSVSEMDQGKIAKEASRSWMSA
jgi:hypothetical protein